MRVLKTAAEQGVWTCNGTGRGCETRRASRWCHRTSETPGAWLAEWSWEIGEEGIDVGFGPLRAPRKEWRGLVGTMKGSTLPSTQRRDNRGMVGGACLPRDTVTQSPSQPSEKRPHAPGIIAVGNSGHSTLKLRRPRDSRGKCEMKALLVAPLL